MRTILNLYCHLCGKLISAYVEEVGDEHTSGRFLCVRCGNAAHRDNAKERKK